MKASNAGYDPRYFEPLFATEDRHFWFLGRNRVICSLARKVLAADGSSRILEVGCGTGFVLKTLENEFSSSTVVGMDLYLEGLMYARRRVNCGLVQGDLSRPPFTGGFDLLGMFDVLEHIEDDRHVLGQLYRLTRPGGHILLTVPADPALWSYFDVASHHVRRYTLQELQSKVQEAGFTCKFVSPFIALTYPMLRLARWIKGQSGALRTINAGDMAEDDLKIIPVINEIIRGILCLEAAWMAGGKRLPFGSSLVVLAEKPSNAPR